MSCLLCYVIFSSFYLLIITLPSVPISVFTVSVSGHPSWCLISFILLFLSHQVHLSQPPASSTPRLVRRSFGEFEPRASLALQVLRTSLSPGPPHIRSRPTAAPSGRLPLKTSPAAWQLSISKHEKPTAAEEHEYRLTSVWAHTHAHTLKNNIYTAAGPRC